MSILIKELKRPLNIVIIISVLAFIYIWGIWGWRDSELFDAAWWFDTAGHAIFGFGVGLALIYLISTYAAKGIFLFAGKRLLAVVVISIIMIVGILWEAVELLWDAYLQPNYFSWYAKAQESSIDTTIDILVNLIFVSFAMIAYRLYTNIYEKLNSNKAEENEINETIEMINHLSQKIRTRRHEHIRHLQSALKQLFQLVGRKILSAKKLKISKRMKRWTKRASRDVISGS